MYEAGFVISKCQDLLLAADLSSVAIDTSSARSNTGTAAYLFTKGSYYFKIFSATCLSPPLLDSSAQISSEKLKFRPDISTNFALSVWIKPRLEDMFFALHETDGSDNMEVSMPILTKFDRTGNMELHVELNILGGSIEDMELIDLFLTYKYVG